MAKVFISHSKANADKAKRLRESLIELGHEIWFDEDQIAVGDLVTGKIQEGIRDADFIVVVLTKEAVGSCWVEREWQARFSEEVKGRRQIVLPALFEDCDIPALLGDKKYADFRTSFLSGLVQLNRTLDAFVRVNVADTRPLLQQATRSQVNEVVLLTSRLGDQSIPLTIVLPEILHLAIGLNDTALTEYCQIQLRGLKGKSYDENSLPAWCESRIMKIWVSIEIEPNLNYFGWNNNIENVWSFIQSNDKFKWFKVIVPDPIQWVENMATNAKPGTIQKGAIRLGELLPDINQPDIRVPTYSRWDTYLDICTRVRQDLVRLLALHIK